MIWDVGGQDRVRPLWKSYTRATDGMVFVVDSDDTERMEEARVELARVARTNEAISVPILVIANKQDLPRARTADQVRHLMLSLTSFSTKTQSLQDQYDVLIMISC